MPESENTNIIDAHNLSKIFPLRDSFWNRFSREKKELRAVDNVSFEIQNRETYGLIGESGCGKTTTGKLAIRLIESTDGEVYFRGTDILRLRKAELRRLRSKIQMIFQNPYDSLDPRMMANDLLSEPLSFHKLVEDETEKKERIAGILEAVNLDQSVLTKRPTELSGGQRQRLCIGRVLLVQPEFIVADEPVSMLDLSIRASILDLLSRLKRVFSLSYLFITHDLAVSGYICDRIGVMYLGKIVESDVSAKVLKEPLHPYTKALKAVMPTLDTTKKRYTEVSKFIRHEIDNSAGARTPKGCRFSPRCPKVMPQCIETDPRLVDTGNKRFVACHLYT